MDASTTETIEAAFTSLYAGSVRQPGAGGLVTGTVSPGALERAPLDEDELALRSLETLRQRGWPLERLEDDELPVLPCSATSRSPRASDG